MEAISTVDMSHTDWLEKRKNGIGGSDVGAVLGLNSYRTPKDVWDDKLGLSTPFEGNEATEWGNRLEDVIAQKWSEEAKRDVQKDNKIRIHKDHPELLVNLDRVITDNQDGRGPGVLEIKTVSGFAFKAWEEDQVPLSYYAQFQHELAVTGWKWGEFGLLVDGRNFKRLPLDRDEIFIKEMTTESVEWWNKYVVPKVSPPLTGNELSKLTTYYEGQKKSVTIDVYNLCQDYLDINERFSALEKQKKDLQNQIKIACGEADIIEHDGQKLATFKLQKGSTYEVNRPAGRVLRVKKPKK